ncbi:hypothetical protein Agub_g5090 [Astrephomene gubernaculifera]|uniref:Uncharacterized protein n=1 Tax=Astrephomene gubernaculifera TaxID=47775 RepID=A0AAD3DLA8_9CHLO|nr:hypothetical protein Agub_g5090 [Astrephomene gubernaculifera]
MRSFRGMSYSAPHQRNMYGILAACLPQLQWLSLPSCRAVVGLAVLAARGGSNLSHLQVSGHNEVSPNGDLELPANTTLSRLAGLRKLHLHSCNLPQSSWRLLRDSLPASLQRLHIDVCSEFPGRRLHARLDAGCFIAVDLLECCGGHPDKLREVRGLLSNLAGGRPLQEAHDLRIDVVELSHVWQLEKVADLRQLGTTFARVHIKRLSWYDTSPAVVAELVEQFGLPEDIRYQSGGIMLATTLTILPQDAGVNAQPGFEEGQQQQPGQPPVHAAGGSQCCSCRQENNCCPWRCSVWCLTPRHP